MEGGGSCPTEMSADPKAQRVLNLEGTASACESSAPSHSTSSSSSLSTSMPATSCRTASLDSTTVEDHNKWKFALKDRSEMKPSIMAQNLRRAKGFVWDHVAGDFVPAASVPAEPVSSAIPRFDREKLHARDDTGCCWFAPPRKRDPRDFRCGGGNYFHAAKVGTRLFKVGQYVLFRDDDENDDGSGGADEGDETTGSSSSTVVVGDETSIVGDVERDGEGGPSDSSSTSAAAAATALAVGRITCLWEGFPQSATISRWVEIRRLRPLSDFDDEAVNMLLRSTKPPPAAHSHRRSGGGDSGATTTTTTTTTTIGKSVNNKKKPELVYTSEFDTFPLTCLHERVGVEFPLARRPKTAPASSMMMQFKKRAPAAAFECRAVHDEEEDRLSWLCQEPSNSASPQFYLSTAGDNVSDDSQDHVRWEHLFTYDVRESSSGKMHTNTPYRQLVRDIGIGGDQDATKARYLPFHEDEDVSIRSSDSGQLVKGRVQRVRVLRHLKNHKSVAQWMFQRLRKHQDIFILSLVDGNGPWPRVSWKRATVIRTRSNRRQGRGGGKSQHSIGLARVRFHDREGCARDCVLAGNAAEVWAFAHPVPSTGLLIADVFGGGANISTSDELFSSPDLPLEKFYKSGGSQSSPALARFRKMLQAAENDEIPDRRRSNSRSSMRVSPTKRHPKLDIAGFYADENRRRGSGRGRSKRRWAHHHHLRSSGSEELKRARRSEAVQVNDTLRNTRQLEKDELVAAETAGIGQASSAILIPTLPAKLNVGILGFLSVHDLLTCTALSTGAYRFCVEQLPTVAAQAPQFVHGQHFPWPLRPSETVKKAFAFKSRMSRAQHSHGSTGQGFLTCGLRSSFVGLAASTSRRRSPLTLGTSCAPQPLPIVCFGSSLPTSCSASHLPRRVFAENTGPPHSTKLQDLKPGMEQRGRGIQPVKLATAKTWVHQRNNELGPSGTARRHSEPPVAILNSDGSVCTWGGTTKSAAGRLSSRWFIVDGLMKFERRVVDIAITGGNFRDPTHRGQLLMVSTEGIIHAYSLEFRSDDDLVGRWVQKPGLSPWRVRERVRSIACGGNFTALLTAEGFLRARGQLQRPTHDTACTWPGAGAGGLLCADHFEDGRAEVLDPDLLAQGTRFKMLAAGAFHLLVVSEEGGLFVAGANDHGQLGVQCSPTTSHACGHTCHKSVVWVDHPVARAGVLKIAAGGRHSLFVASCTTQSTYTCPPVGGGGIVYGMGSNSHGQLALPLSTSSTLIQRLPFSSSVNTTLPFKDVVHATSSHHRPSSSAQSTHRPVFVRSVAAGLQHSVFQLSTSGRVFTCGGGAKGQLGHSADVSTRASCTLSVSARRGSPEGLQKGQYFACSKCGAMEAFTIGLKRYAEEEKELKKARQTKLATYRQDSKSTTGTGTAHRKDQYRQQQSSFLNQGGIDKSVKTRSTLLPESQRPGFSQRAGSAAAARPHFNPTGSTTQSALSSSSTSTAWTPLPRDPLAEAAPRRKSTHCLQQAMRHRHHQQQIRRQQQQQQQQCQGGNGGDGSRSSLLSVAKVGGAKSPPIQYDASTALISAQSSNAALRGAGLTRNPIAGTTRVSSRAAMLAARGATTAAAAAAAAGVKMSRNPPSKRARLLRHVAPSGGGGGTNAATAAASSILSVEQRRRQDHTRSTVHGASAALVPAEALFRHGRKAAAEKPSPRYAKEKLFFCRFCSSQQNDQQQQQQQQQQQRSAGGSDNNRPRLQVVQLPVTCVTPTEVTCVASPSLMAEKLQ